MSFIRTALAAAALTAVAIPAAAGGGVPYMPTLWFPNADTTAPITQPAPVVPSTKG